MPQWQALIISMAIEACVVVATMVFALRFSCRNAMLGGLAIASATLMTHPCAWFLNQYVLWRLSFALRATIIESLVTVAEACIVILILSLSRRHGLFVAALANAASFFSGLVILSAFSSQ